MSFTTAFGTSSVRKARVVFRDWITVSTTADVSRKSLKMDDLRL